jgi:hypothetical protein
MIGESGVFYGLRVSSELGCGSGFENWLRLYPAIAAFIGQH